MFPGWRPMARPRPAPISASAGRIMRGALAPAQMGRPLPHREAMIVDEAFAPLGDAAFGELVVRGGAMMQDYWRNPAAWPAVTRRGSPTRWSPQGYDPASRRERRGERDRGRSATASEGGARRLRRRSRSDPIRDEETKVSIARSGEVSVHQLVANVEARSARFKLPRYWTFEDTLPMTASERVAKPQLSREIGADVVDFQDVLRKHVSA